MSGGEARDLYTLMNHVVSFHVLEVQKTHARVVPAPKICEAQVCRFGGTGKDGFPGVTVRNEPGSYSVQTI